MTKSIDLRQTAIALAVATITQLLDQHKITDPEQAKRQVRERLNDEELQRYTQARDLLDGMGALG